MENTPYHMVAKMLTLPLLVLLSLPAALALSCFGSQREYLQYLQSTSALPAGFQVGTARFNFQPFEVDKILPMNLFPLLRYYFNIASATHIT
jgi:hypothetical protein